MTSKTYTLSQITAQLGGEWRGKDISVAAVRPLADAQAEHISFLANPKYKAEVHDSSAGAVIVSAKAVDEFEGRNLIVADDPYLYFAKVARLFSPIVKARGGIHPTAVVEEGATRDLDLDLFLCICHSQGRERSDCDEKTMLDIHVLVTSCLG